MKIISFINTLYNKNKVSASVFPSRTYSLVYGFIGFLSFLTIIVTIKYLKFVFGDSEVVTIDLLDIVLSITGFILIYIFKKLEQRFKND